MPESSGKETVSWVSVHLDAIRGAAALVVLLGHTRGLFFRSFTSQATKAPSAQTGAPHLTMGGAAVIVFFVLSGYLVGGSVIRSIRTSTWSWKRYLVKRITRLWVVLLPAIAGGILLDRIGAHIAGRAVSIYAAPGSTLIPHDLPWRLGWKVAVGNALFLQGILTPTAGTNNSLWSLAYEWWYYLMFPLALLVFARRTATLLRVVYGCLLAGIAVFVGREIVGLFPSWLLGAAIAAFAAETSLRRVVALPLLAISAVALIAVKALAVHYYLAIVCLGLAFSVILWCVLHHRGVCTSERYRRISGFFSNISYTLYLTHLPVAVFICALANRPWRYRSLSTLNLALFLCMNACIIGISYLCYQLFERNTDRVRAAVEGLRLTAWRGPQRSQGREGGRASLQRESVATAAGGE